MEEIGAERRTSQVHTFLTKSEKARMKSVAAGHGLAQSAFIRSLILREIREHEEEPLAELREVKAKFFGNGPQEKIA